MARPRGSTLTALFEVSDQERKDFFDRIQKRIHGAPPDPASLPPERTSDTEPTDASMATGAMETTVVSVTTVGKDQSEAQAATSATTDVTVTTVATQTIDTNDTTVASLAAVGTVTTVAPHYKNQPRVIRTKNAQHGHTVWEQALYEFLWKEAKPKGDESREISIGYRHIAALTGLSIRTVQRNMKSLEQKLALEPIGRYDPDTRTPKTYRVFSYKTILDRRHRAGLDWVIINRQGVLLVGDPSSATVASQSTVVSQPTVRSQPTAVSIPTVVKVATGHTQPTGTVVTVPTENCRQGGDSFRELEKKSRQSSSLPNFTVISTALSAFGPVDDDAIHQLVQACQAVAPDATEDEIAHFTRLKGDQLRKRRDVENPIGLLLTAVPRCFQSLMLNQYRRDKQQRDFEQRQQAEKILHDPGAGDDERELAHLVLNQGSDEHKIEN